MAIQLENIIPVGRSLDEYIRMFNLTAQELSRSILSVADGPASFNSEGTIQGYQIKSIDPIYRFSAEQIRYRFQGVIDDIIQQVEQTPDDWVWTYHESPQGLKKHRILVIQRFCQDFEVGKIEGRYVVGELPTLNDADQEFDLGLCSHFLFLYSDHLNEQFHLDSIQEMLRVCREIRIFPLLTLQLERSPYLDTVMRTLGEKGFVSEIQKVDYELQRGGCQMLKIKREAT